MTGFMVLRLSFCMFVGDVDLLLDAEKCKTGTETQMSEGAVMMGGDMYYGSI
jgi:hypothetical protein